MERRGRASRRECPAPGAGTVRRPALAAAALALALAAGSCGDGDAFLFPQAQSFEAVTETEATGTVGSPVETPPRVRVRDGREVPVPGARVVFEAEEGAGSVSPDTVLTDRTGEAGPGSWVLGEAAGVHVVVARVPGSPDFEIRFEAVAEPGPPAESSAESAEMQEAQVGAGVEEAPAVRVRDEFGNPVPGVQVAFDPDEESGTVEGTPATTDEEGIAAAASWTLGAPADTQTVRARVMGPEGQGLPPVLFRAVGQAGPPGHLEPQSPLLQEVEIGEAVAEPPTLQVQDDFGNPLPGVEVAFEPGPDAGTVDGSPTLTDAEGTAAVRAWTVGTASGIRTLTARVTGQAGADVEPLVFEADVLAGPPAEMEAASPESQEGVVGLPAPDPPAVLFRDEFGNPVPGVSVTFDVLEGGGEVDGSPAESGPEGVATAAAWVLGDEPGPNRLRALVEDRPELGEILFEAEAELGPPAALEAVSAESQEAEVGTEVPEPPAVRVTDHVGNLLPDVEVLFEPEEESGSVEGSPALTDEEGVAAAQSWTLGTTAGLQTLTARVAGEEGDEVDPVVFEAEALAGAAASLEAASAESQAAEVGTAVPDPPAVLVVDEFGNPVSGVSVTFQVVLGGGSVQGSPAVSDEEGAARVNEWVLGTSEGMNRVRAFVLNAPELGEVLFEAEGFETPPVFSVETVQLNQGSQNLEGTIRGVEGRPGLLRVVVTADKASTLIPDVRLHLFSGTTEYGRTLTIPGDSVPVNPDLGVLRHTWNWHLLEVPPDLRVVAILDPDSVLPLDDRDGHRYPRTGGSAPLNVDPLPTFHLMVFPIFVLPANRTGNVTEGNLEDFLRRTRQWIPTGEISHTLRGPFTTEEDPDEDGALVRILNELIAARIGEGASEEYYHGIFPDGIGLGSGIGMVPEYPGHLGGARRVAVSVDRLPIASLIVAHELGHNLGRGHAPCGPVRPESVDEDFPYPNADIGVPGYDVFEGVLRLPGDYPDYMSYCTPAWTSDFHYEVILEWRRDDPLATEAPPAPSSGLLVSGRISPRDAVLEPAFALTTRPVLPDRDGPYTVRGVAMDGRELFRLSFEGTPVADAPDPDELQFGFFVPLSPEEVGAVERIELSGPGVAEEQVSAVRAAWRPGDPLPSLADPALHLDRVAADRVRLRWDAGLYPRAMVRDRESGHVLAILRSGDATLPLSGLTARADRLEVLLSDGAATLAVTPNP